MREKVLCRLHNITSSKGAEYILDCLPDHLRDVSPASNCLLYLPSSLLAFIPFINHLKQSQVGRANVVQLYSGTKNHLRTFWEYKKYKSKTKTKPYE